MLSIPRVSRVVLPALYGIGTGLPVAVFAIGLAVGAQTVSAAFNRLGVVERWARRATGAVFIVVGVYYTLDHVLELF